MIYSLLVGVTSSFNTAMTVCTCAHGNSLSHGQRITSYLSQIKKGSSQGGLSGYLTVTTDKGKTFRLFVKLEASGFKYIF